MAVLIVIDRAPYGDWRGREALDMAFSLAAFDQPVSLLFAGAGVNWLRPDQNGAPVAQKTLTKQLQAAAIFGIDDLLVDTQAMTQYGLAAEDTEPAAQAVTVDSALLTRFHHVVQL